MTCYKLVTCEFKWFGLQNKIENLIQSVCDFLLSINHHTNLASQFDPQTERRLFFNFHRQVFCSLDKWHGKTIEDIRKHEEETKKQLDEVSFSLVDPLGQHWSIFI